MLGVAVCILLHFSHCQIFDPKIVASYIVSWSDCVCMHVRACMYVEFSCFLWVVKLFPLIGMSMMRNA